MSYISVLIVYIVVAYLHHILYIMLYIILYILVLCYCSRAFMLLLSLLLLLHWSIVIDLLIYEFSIVDIMDGDDYSIVNAVYRYNMLILYMVYCIWYIWYCIWYSILLLLHIVYLILILYYILYSMLLYIVCYWYHIVYYCRLLWWL